MVLIGVILILLAAGAGVLLFAGTAQLTDTVDITLVGGTLSLPPLTLLVTGMVVISVFWLGWVLLRSGLRRGSRKRAEAKEAAAAAEARRVEDERRMKDEAAARERELAEERRRHEAETAALRQQVGQTPGSSGPGTAAVAGGGTRTAEPGAVSGPDAPTRAADGTGTGTDTTMAPGSASGEPGITPSGSTPPPPPPTRG